MLKNKICSSRRELAETVTKWQLNGEKVVFTNGCFDLLHPGHVTYLEQAKSLGNRLIIGVNTDASVSKLKGEHRPIQSQQARCMVLAALESVDALVLFNEDTPKELIETVKPNILVKGGDYTIETIVGADFIMKNGGEVKVIPFLDGYSTTAIEERILKAKS
ncbi:MAG: D-glycero-beta-D-manno-heptose 1-phosphate adenylyltransferase [Bacteroidetes bacterium]|nr:D-glycero-beta-D-manno-heptose 1-phosphate adenylyltransferase [Bacteroidota bacterium]